MTHCWHKMWQTDNKCERIFTIWQALGNQISRCYSFSLMHQLKITRIHVTFMIPRRKRRKTNFPRNWFLHQAENKKPFFREANPSRKRRKALGVMFPASHVCLCCCVTHTNRMDDIYGSLCYRLTLSLRQTEPMAMGSRVKIANNCLSWRKITLHQLCHKMAINIIYIAYQFKWESMSR